uniref:Uncharacterized protein n=1 Tax=Aegilops tauschii TaxID=37682 RepID=M8B7Z0_AEGTA
MGSTSKAVVIFGILVFLQVSGAAGPAMDLRALISLNGFQQGEEGGPAACEGQYHSDGLFLVALNTAWYENGARCGKVISINSCQEHVWAKYNCIYHMSVKRVVPPRTTS